MELANQIYYFRECFKADNRTVQISNIFQPKIEHRYFIPTGEELLKDAMPYIPVPADYVQKVEKSLLLYPKEKALYYTSLFIVGKRDTGLNNEARVCAPLFITPAEIIQEGDHHYLSIDINKKIVNINFLNQIKRDSIDDLYRIIQKNLPPEFLSEQEITKVIHTLEKNLENVDASELLTYPKFIEEKKLKTYRGTNENEFKVFPASVACILRKSSNTVGVVSELTELASSNRFSPPIRKLFSGDNSYTMGSKVGVIPAVLNADQEHAVEQANRNVVSTIIGPPGTGKSYTTAALAIELISKGKKVLIVSKNNLAVNVIANKIEKDYGIKDLALRAGRKEYKKELRNRIEGILSGAIHYKLLESVEDDKNPNEDRLKVLVKEIDRTENALLSNLAKEMEWSKSVHQKEAETDLWSTIVNKYLEWRTNSQEEPSWKLCRRLFSLLREKNEVSRQYILWQQKYALDRLLLHKRRNLVAFMNALKARTSSKRELLFKEADFSTILEVFPIWLCGLSDLANVLPLQESLFDYVIIDEATQCDIATCLPALQRSKRAVVVGDPKQLRHVSFLSHSVQAGLIKQFKLKESEKLNYRYKSILDLCLEDADSQDSITFLREHFRSAPQIIQFSNKHFYYNKLKIMTALPDHQLYNCLYIESIQGKRNSKGINAQEVDAILDKIKELIEDQRQLDSELAYSIGILSPFRDQVEYIKKQLIQRISAQSIAKHQIIVGTAHAFQGDERDVMYLSFCVDGSSHPTAIRHINQEDVFNVSITRARNYQYVSHSFSKANLTSNDLLYQYLNQNHDEPFKNSLLTRK